MITQSNDIKRFFERLGLRMNFHKPKRVSPGARHNLEYIAGSLQPSRRMEPLLTFYFKDVRYSGFDTYSVRLEDFKETGHGAIGVCRLCGCTRNDACPDKVTGIGCHWVTEDLCSACDTTGQQIPEQTLKEIFETGGKP